MLIIKSYTEWYTILHPKSREWIQLLCTTDTVTLLFNYLQQSPTLHVNCSYDKARLSTTTALLSLLKLDPLILYKPDATSIHCTGQIVIYAIEKYLSGRSGSTNVDNDDTARILVCSMQLYTLILLLSPCNGPKSPTSPYYPIDWEGVMKQCLLILRAVCSLPIAYFLDTYNENSAVIHGRSEGNVFRYTVAPTLLAILVQYSNFSKYNHVYTNVSVVDELAEYLHPSYLQSVISSAYASLDGSEVNTDSGMNNKGDNRNNKCMSSVELSLFSCRLPVCYWDDVEKLLRESSM